MRNLKKLAVAGFMTWTVMFTGLVFWQSERINTLQSEVISTESQLSSSQHTNEMFDLAAVARIEEISRSIKAR